MAGGAMSAESVNLADYAENLTIAYSEAYIGSNAEQETMQEMARLIPHLVSRIRELEAGDN
jgi:hypothetical protein